MLPLLIFALLSDKVKGDEYPILHPFIIRVFSAANSPIGLKSSVKNQGEGVL